MSEHDQEDIQIAALFVLQWEMSIMESGTAVFTYDLPEGVSPGEGDCAASVMKAQDGGYALMFIFSDGTPIMLLNVGVQMLQSLHQTTGARVAMCLHDGRMLRCDVGSGIEGIGSALHDADLM